MAYPMDGGEGGADEAGIEPDVRRPQVHPLVHSELIGGGPRQHRTGRRTNRSRQPHGTGGQYCLLIGDVQGCFGRRLADDQLLDGEGSTVGDESPHLTLHSPSREHHVLDDRAQAVPAGDCLGMIAEHVGTMPHADRLISWSDPVIQRPEPGIWGPAHALKSAYRLVSDPRASTIAATSAPHAERRRPGGTHGLSDSQPAYSQLRI